MIRIRGHRNKLTQEHLVWMRIPSRFWSAKFAGLQGDTVIGVVKNYLSDLDRCIEEGDGLVLWGPNGTRKTGAAVVVAKEARCLGASVLFLTAESLREATLERERFDGDLTTSDRAKQVDVLVIDDLGKEHAGDSGWAERMIENLLRYRSANKKSTIITTNMSPAKMETRYKTSMMEVLRENTVFVASEGDSCREESEKALLARLSK